MCLFPITVGSSVFSRVLARGARVPLFLLLHHLCEAQVMQQQEPFFVRQGRISSCAWKAEGVGNKHALHSTLYKSASLSTKKEQ